jgi:hypothetical protein
LEYIYIYIYIHINTEIHMESPDGKHKRKMVEAIEIKRQEGVQHGTIQEGGGGGHRNQEAGRGVQQHGAIQDCACRGYRNQQAGRGAQHGTVHKGQKWLARRGGGGGNICIFKIIFCIYFRFAYIEEPFCHH